MSILKKFYIFSILLLLVSILSIFVTTTGKMAFPPFYIIFFPFTIIILTYLFLNEDKLLTNILIIIITSLVAGNILFLDGFPRGHDARHHLWGIWGFFKTFKEGNLYPLWISNIGLGSPLTLFYPPLNFYIPLPFQLSNFSPINALKASYILGNFFAGISIYFLVMEICQKRKAALISGIFYIMAPYRLLDMNYRVAFGEANAFIFIPLPFIFLLRIIYGRGKFSINILLGSISIALLILTHLLTAFMVMIFILIFSAILIFFQDGKKKLKVKIINISVMCLLGLGISSFFWFPALTETKDISLSGGLYYKGKPIYILHALTITQPFERKLWYGWKDSIKEDIYDKKDLHNKKDEMPFYVGIMLFSSAILALYKNRSPIIIALTICSIIALLMSIRTLSFICYIIPFLKFLQFPWRFLSPLTCFLCTLSGIGIVTSFEERELFKKILMSLWLIVSIIDFSPFTGAPDLIPNYKELNHFSFNKDKKCNLFYKCSNIIKINVREKFLTIKGVDYPPSDYNLNIRILDRIHPLYNNNKVSNYIKSDDKKVLSEFGVSYSCNIKRNICDKIEPKGYATSILNNEVIPLDFKFIPDGIEIIGDMKKGSKIIINEQYFHGWEAKTDTCPATLSKTKDGRISVTIQEDTPILHLKFGFNTPFRIIGLLISIISAIILVIFQIVNVGVLKF